MTLRDQIVAEGAWQFDDTVADVFDEMLERSIPGYAMMRSLVTDLAVEFAKPDSYIVDLGCSRGGALLPIIERLGAYNKYLGVEISEPMRTAAEQNLGPWIRSGHARVASLDLRDEYPKVPASVVLSVLTLMFTPIEYRQQLLTRVYDSLPSGGAFILVEKVLGADYHADALLKRLYYSMKGANGYTEEQINAKRRSLEGVLVPVTEQMNRSLLESVGFRHIDSFWRYLNFAGWIAVKP